MIRQRLFRNDHAGRVRRGMTGEPLERPGDGHELPHLWIRVDQFPEPGLRLECLLERDVQLVGDQFRDFVGVGVGHLQDAPHVSNGGLGPERPERDDLGHVIRSVFIDDIIEDFSPAVHAEVHVDIGERHPFGVQEPLEQQRVDEWIEIGDAQRIGDQAAGGGSSARPHGDATAAGKPDDVPDDQEIAGESHRTNDHQLFAQALFIDRHGDGARAFRQTGLQAFDRQVLDIGFARVPFRSLILRQMRLVERQLEFAVIGDPTGVGDGPGKFCKRRRDFFGRLHIELVGIELHSGRIAQRLARLEAEHELMRPGESSFFR